MSLGRVIMTRNNFSAKENGVKRFYNKGIKMTDKYHFAIIYFFIAFVRMPPSMWIEFWLAHVFICTPKCDMGNLICPILLFLTCILHVHFKASHHY